MSHTPGPWEIRSSIPYGDGLTIFHGRFEQNYTVCTWRWKYGNVEDDARLIAAAPELLEALKECEEYFDQRADADHNGSGYIGNAEMNYLTVVRAAIAKATGGAA